MRERQRTGAATLLIHILAMDATSMCTKRTEEGLPVALESTKEASYLAMPYLLRAAAMANPPRRSMMTGESIDAKTTLEASMALNRVPSEGERITRKVMARKGTRSAVTNNGKSSVAHKRLAKTRIAKQRRCSIWSKKEGHPIKPPKTARKRHKRMVFFNGQLGGAGC